MELWPEFESVMAWLNSLKGKRVHVDQMLSLRPGSPPDKYWTTTTSFRTTVKFVQSVLAGCRIVVYGSDGAQCEVFADKVERSRFSDGAVHLVERTSEGVERLTTVRLLEPRGDG